MPSAALAPVPHRAILAKLSCDGRHSQIIAVVIAAEGVPADDPAPSPGAASGGCQPARLPTERRRSTVTATVRTAIQRSANSSGPTASNPLEKAPSMITLVGP